jgi:hypothetical protein
MRVWDGCSLLSQEKSLHSRATCVVKARVQLGVQLIAQTAEGRDAPQARERWTSRVERRSWWETD